MPLGESVQDLVDSSKAVIRHRLREGQTPDEQRISSVLMKHHANEVTHLASQLVWAITIYHKKGYNHRDLKMTNAVLLPDGDVYEKKNVKLIDVVHSVMTARSIEQVVGSDENMSPTVFAAFVADWTEQGKHELARRDGWDDLQAVGKEIDSLRTMATMKAWPDMDDYAVAMDM